MVFEIITPILNVASNKWLFILVVIIITFSSASFLNSYLKRSYERSVKYREKHKKIGKLVSVVNKTRFNVFRRVVISIIYLSGLLLVISAFPQLKTISYSLFAGAGVIAIIIGFATQEVFSNIVSGFFISIFEPFRIDDRVTIGNDMGIVEDITLWHTVIKTFNNQRLMVPNSKIAKEKIENNTIYDEATLNFIDFGISYDSNIDKAKKIISKELQKSEHYFDNKIHHRYLKKEVPYIIRVISHGDFSIGLRLYAWTKTSGEGFLLKCELLENVKKVFDKEGIEIPFPYRTIVYKDKLNKQKS